MGGGTSQCDYHRRNSIYQERQNSNEQNQVQSNDANQEHYHIAQQNLLANIRYELGQRILETQVIQQAEQPVECDTPTQVPPISMNEEKIQMPFNLIRDSFRLRKVTDSTSKFYVCFKYDSQIKVSITVYFAAMDVMDTNLQTIEYFYDATRYPDPITKELSAGTKKSFPKKLVIFDTDIIDDKILKNQYEDLYPLLIEIKPAEQNQSKIESQTTFISFKQNKAQKYKAQIHSQKVKIEGIYYDLSPIFGLKNVEELQIDTEQCAIWLSNKKDTIVLPCSHYCLCSSWVKTFRMKNQRECPICRAKISSFLKVV